MIRHQLLRHDWRKLLVEAFKKQPEMTLAEIAAVICLRPCHMPDLMYKLPITRVRALPRQPGQHGRTNGIYKLTNQCPNCGAILKKGIV